MKNDNLSIEFVKLKDGKHTVNFDAGKEFFEEFGNEDVKDASLSIVADIDKSSNWMHVMLHISGSISQICDRCLVAIPFPITTKYRLIVKLDGQGETVQDSEDQETELVYLRASDFKLSIAQQVYESALLALPMLRNCDDLDIKPCDQAMLSKLEKLQQVASDSSDEDNGEIDERWLKLKDILK